MNTYNKEQKREYCLKNKEKIREQKKEYYLKNRERILKKRKERHKKTYVKMENYKGENHHHWKGDKVGYKALHKWLRENKHKPQFCEKCKIKEPYDVANISGEYKRDFNDFEWLCRSCHIKSDGRINNLKQGGNKNANKL